MNFYNQLNSKGQLWLRTPKGEKTSANIALSSIFLKYENIDSSFYFDLNNNNIERFDIIQDTLFIETSSGFIFEKFYVDDFLIKPYSNANQFQQFLDTKIDYWYDETYNSIYYANILKTEQKLAFPLINSIGNQNTLLSLINTSSTILESLSATGTLQSFSFLLKLNKFNCDNNRTELKTTYKIQIGINYSNSEWSKTQYTIETPKITFNSDTQIYNVSFILRNYNNKIGLISINFEEKEIFEITELNGFLPYFETNPLNSYIEKYSI